MLQTVEMITKVGYTVIDGVNAVQYTCQIPVEKPEGMTVRRTVLKPALYEKHRDECRSDFARFEDDAFATRDALIYVPEPVVPEDEVVDIPEETPEMVEPEVEDEVEDIPEEPVEDTPEAVEPENEDIPEEPVEDIPEVEDEFIETPEE